MATIEQAEKVLRDAQAALQTLIEDALREQRFAELAEVAKFADGIGRLLRGQGAGTVELRAPKEASKPPGHGSAQRPRERIVKAVTKYPHFFRDGNSLVKVGWSKKQRDVYEHRAPRSALEAFVRSLVERARPGKPFAMEGLLPVHDPTTGSDIPAYQAYLALAWLREVGAVEKKGRDDYILRTSSLLDGEFDNLWDGVAEHSAQ